MNSIDVLVFGAHPDDIEIGCGGTLIKLSAMGYRIVLVDMVWGEMATRGTVETRKTEVEKASKILGINGRENLALQDANIRVTEQSKAKVVKVIRKYRPQMVIMPYFKDRHPDHYHTSRLVYESLFLAGLSRYETGQESYRPQKILYFMGWKEFNPSFIVDISSQFEKKMKAIFSYATQFKPDDNFYKQTRLTSREYNWLLRSRMAYYGSLIGKKYGEGFLICGNLEIENPLKLIFSSF